jgi:hypothetical protein
MYPLKHNPYKDTPVRTKLTHPYNFDPITVWVSPDKPTDSVYSDRLYTWDPEKHNLLCRKHFGDEGQYWSSRPPEKIQDFLRDYKEMPNLVLCEIQEQCNQATGYPVWYFAYRKE